MKNFDFYKEREQKRETLKQELPIDKQLEGSLGKTKWKFETPLYTLRNSESPSDQYFIEKLKQYSNNDSLDSQLDTIEIAKEKEEKDFLLNIKGEILFLKGLSDSGSYVRRGTTQSLGALALVNPELASQLYEKGLSDNDSDIRMGTTQSLGALALVNPELYAKLYEKGLSDNDIDVRRGTAQSLGALAPVNPELTSQLYEKGSSDNDVDVRQGTAESLGALAPVNPELASQLYEKGLSDSNWDVRMGTAKSLGALASVNPELYTKLYEKGLSDNDIDVRRGTAQSLGALAPVNPELASQLYEKGLSDNDIDVRRGTAQSLGALAPVNPELASQLYEKGLSDSSLYVRQGTAKSLNNYHFQNNPLNQKVNKIINGKTNESNNIFITNLLSQTISEKQPAKIWQYLDVFNKVGSHLEEKNKDLDAVKQVSSVEKFFSDNQLELSNLAKIFSPKEFGIFLTTLSADTLLYTKSFLEIAGPVCRDQKVNASLKNYFASNSLRQDEIEKIFETGVQFIKTNKTEQFISVVDKGENVQEALDRMLLDVTAQEVGIDSSTLPSESLKRWNTPYLAYLGSNNKIIEDRIKDGEGNYKNVQALYKKIVEHGFIGDFKQFILEINSGDEIGEDIAGHNENVFAKFKDLGIDPKIWYEYADTKDFLVSKEVKVDNTKHFQETLGERAKVVIDLLSQIKDELTPRQYEPLMHILQGAKNKGLSDITNYEELKKQYQLLSDRIIKIKDESFKDSKEEYFGSLFEHLGHLEEAVELFKKENLSGTETKEQGFRVKLWDRDPARDLFQGNYTHCCIAVGVKDAPQEGGLYTHDPATVAQFLADAGVQVAEVYDQERKDPIANTWLFVSKDSNGEPVLVLDNVEVNNKYKDVVVNSAIRDNLFSFAKDYAKKCNIPKVGIGMVGTNDIEWQSLDKMVVAPVDKVGGYLKEYTSTDGNRAGRYYLEAYNAQTLGEIYNEEKNKSTKIEKKEKTFSGSVTVIDMQRGASESFDNTAAGIQSFAQRRNLSLEQLQSDIENIENNSFAGSNLSDSIEEILATLTSPKGIGFIFMEGNKVVGYLSSLSADKFTPLVNHREYDASDKALYIESIAGKVDPYQTLQKLKEQAKAGGYEKIIFHGINTRLNEALIRFGFEKKATIDNWGGNKADYMELVLD
jgi:HEAT repeat protein